MKSLFYCLAFSLFHFLHDWFPNALTVVISGTGESVFQHMKIGFWAWIAVSAFEYALLSVRERAVKSHPDAFVFSRMTGSALSPLLVFITWYASAAVFGKMPNDFIEIVNAFVCVFISGLVQESLERTLEREPVRLDFRVASSAFFILTAFLMIAFRDSMPWVDVFVEPL